MGADAKVDRESAWKVKSTFEIRNVIASMPTLISEYHIRVSQL